MPQYAKEVADRLRKCEIQLSLCIKKGAQIVLHQDEKDGANIFAYGKAQKMKKITIQQINLHCNKCC